jgi:tRNA A-37 threonylcarbamoyl transferase component Bud32
LAEVSERLAQPASSSGERKNSDDKSEKPEKPKQQNASCLPIFGKVSESQTMNCIVPKDSQIIKQGELLKLGKKTQMMMARFYVLRDHALYIYNNRDQQIPSNIISLRGLYVNPLKDDSRSSLYGFSLTSDRKNLKPRIFYHQNHKVVESWIQHLQR